ncbi:hypothetical protein IMZ48_22630, partial [Candidatus Bathyarchaeota archaeon]|nr:hypothetical protein [Candidatus Bathyarchaeota archaeon]
EEEGGGSGGGKKKGVNAGAIAGGVVGGVAVLGAIGLGILFLRRKKGKEAPPAPAVQQWTQPGSPQYASPGVPYFKPGQEMQGHPPAGIPQHHQQGVGGLAPDRNSSVSPRESQLSGYAYQGQFQQGQPVQGQQPLQGQHVPQGQQLYQGQHSPQGQPAQPIPELGGHH